MGFIFKSNYIEFDATDELAPLLYCIYEIIIRGEDLEYYLRGTIGKDPIEPSGGEPGWSLYSEIKNDGRIVYLAWVDEMIGLEHNEGKYSEDIVKYQIKKALENVLKEQPNRKKEIYNIFKKYEL